jgi:hypothetical protein
MHTKDTRSTTLLRNSRDARSDPEWITFKAAVEPLAQTMSGGGTGTKTGTDVEGRSQQKET